MLGASVGNYQVIAQIGAGGMGAVYRAQHTMLGRPAAVKVLLPELSQSRELVQRFFNEARAATAIRHPGIVEIYDFGLLPDNSAYIIMEMLEGENLGRRLHEQGPPPLDHALVLIRQIAGALAAAHERQIIHRDLKPDNVFIVKDPEVPGGERIKLLDFGIAKLAAEEGGDPTAGSQQKMGTRTGTVMGTPAYMSPEQCRGTGPGRIDARSDLYSLGCILYELVCGRPPFVAEGSGDIIAHHLYFPPEPPRRLSPGLPGALETLVLRLLQKEPAARPQSAAQLIAEIDSLRASGALVGAGGLIPPKAQTTLALTSDLRAGSSGSGGVMSGETTGPSTTLNGSAVVAKTVSVRRSGGNKVALAAGGVTLVAAAVLALVLRGKNATSQTSPSTPAMSVASSRSTDEPAKDPEPSAGGAVAVDPTKTVLLQLIIRPAGAPYQIRIAGQPVAKPEIDVPMSRKQKVAIEVTAKGYLPYQQEWIPISDQTISVDLQPEKRGGSSSSAHTAPAPVIPPVKKPEPPAPTNRRERVDRVEQL